MNALVITGTGAVCWEGLGQDALARVVSGAARPWDEEDLGDGRTVRVGRVGRLVDAGSAAAYDRWGQIDSYSRFGFSAARQALGQAALLGPGARRDEVGVVFGTAWGCVEENQRFERWDVVDGKVAGAAPIIFKVTVDNAPAAWTAVAFGLRGPTETFVSGDGAAFEALWSAEGLLRQGHAPALVVGGVERFVDLHTALFDRDPQRHGEVLSEGAGAVLLEREDWRPGRPVLASFLGVERGMGPFSQELRAACARKGIPWASLGGIVAGGPRAGEDAAAMHPDVPVLPLKALVGEPHGAFGGLAVVAAIGLLSAARDAGRPYVVVHGHGEADEHFFVFLSAPEVP